MRRNDVLKATYSAQDSRSIANVRHIAKWFGIAGDEGVSHSNARRGNTGTTVHNRWTDDVSVHSLFCAGFEHESVRLPVEHVLVDSFDVFLVRIVPNLALRIEVARSAEINEIASTADVDEFALGSVRFGFLSSDDGRYEVASERATGVDDDVVLFAQSTYFLKVIESANGDAVGLETGFELVFWLCAADVGCHGPVWVSLFDGLDIRSLGDKVSIAFVQRKQALHAYLQRSRKRRKR